MTNKTNNETVKFNGMDIKVVAPQKDYNAEFDNGYSLAMTEQRFMNLHVKGSQLNSKRFTMISKYSSAEVYVYGTEIEDEKKYLLCVMLEDMRTTKIDIESLEGMEVLSGDKQSKVIFEVWKRDFFKEHLNRLEELAKGNNGNEILNDLLSEMKDRVEGLQYYVNKGTEWYESKYATLDEIYAVVR